MGLKRFIVKDGLPQSESEIIAALKHPAVKKILHFVLGPRKISNIPQAAEMWIVQNELTGKSELVIGLTPDVYIKDALAVSEEGTVVLVWTCAVYGQEKDLFFGHLDTVLFFVQQTMPLDHMQLATSVYRLPQNEQNWQAVINGISEKLSLPSAWKTLASHPSPKPLLDPLLNANSHVSWVQSTSNGAAAEECAAGKVDACICTETARQDTGLIQIWDFGTPDMVFFGGLTEAGAGVVRQAHQAVLDQYRLTG